MHPYYPITIQLNGYQENTYTQGYLLTTAFIYFLMIFIPCMILSGTNPRLTLNDKLRFFWFIFNFLIHVVFEGYIIYYHKNFYQNNGILDQLWKEYSKCDSRYLTKDALVLCLEGITVLLIGPLCFINSMYIYFDSSKQHILGIFIEWFHIISCSIYFITSYLQGFTHTRPEPLYSFVYFFLMNVPWIIIPILNCYSYYEVTYNALLDVKYSQLEDKQDSKRE